MDPAFKQRLIADPARVLQEEGIEVPRGISIQVIDESKTSEPEIINGFLYLPAKPAGLEGKFAAEDLHQVATGMSLVMMTCSNSCSCRGCYCATQSSNCICHACGPL
jgi:hypothetical protein